MTVVNHCINGQHRCVEYNDSSRNVLNFQYFLPYNQNTYARSVTCNLQNPTYNYNKLEVMNQNINHGFGVIKNILCANMDDQVCGPNAGPGTGDRNIIAIILTDSIEIMDVNNSINLLND